MRIFSSRIRWRQDNVKSPVPVSLNISRFRLSETLVKRCQRQIKAASVFLMPCLPTVVLAGETGWTDGWISSKERDEYGGWSWPHSRREERRKKEEKTKEKQALGLEESEDKDEGQMTMDALRRRWVYKRMAKSDCSRNCSSAANAYRTEPGGPGRRCDEYTT